MALTGEERSLLLFFLRKCSGDRDHIRVGAPGLGLVIRSSAKSRVSQGKSYSSSLINMTGCYCLCSRLMITREWANPNALALFPFCCCDKHPGKKKIMRQSLYLGLQFQKMEFKIMEEFGHRQGRHGSGSKKFFKHILSSHREQEQAMNQKINPKSPPPMKYNL